MRFVFNYLKEKQSFIALLISGLALLGQFSIVSGYLMQSAATQAIVSATDEDAGTAIEVAAKTRWYKDNGWTPYGPVYYRLVHSLNAILPNILNQEGLTPVEAYQKSIHFFLSWVSLISLIAFSLFLSTFISTQWPIRLALASTLAASFLANKVWMQLIFKAHPDHLFTLLVGIATLLTFKALSYNKNQKMFRIAALCWGLVACTKLTFSLFAPALLLAWGFPLNKENLRRGFNFLLWAFLGYFLIGFPQTIVLDGPIKFLLKQGQYGQMADLESLRDWCNLFIDQLWRPLLVLLIARLTLSDFKQSFDKKILAPAMILIFVPLILLLSRKLVYGHDYYTFPFISSLLVFGLYFSSSISRDIEFLRRNALLTVLFILFAGRLTFGLTPETLDKEFSKQQVCRSEAAAMEKKVTALLQSNTKMHIDPYVPYSRETNKDLLVKGSWHMSWAKITEAKARALALRSGYYKRYLLSETPSAYVLVDNPEWPESQKLYRSLFEQTKVTDPSGQVWLKTYENACEWELWELQP